jgi:hypothetical protein
MLDPALRTGDAAQVPQPAYSLEHDCHSNFADVLAETTVRAPAPVDIGVQRAGEVDGIGVGEDIGVVGGSYLKQG